MSKPSKSLAVNFVSLLFGTVGSKVLALVSVMMLTRYLGVAQFGQYSLVFSYYALLNTLVDLGSTSLFAREVAENRKQARHSVEASIYVRLLGCAVFLVPALWFAQALHLGNDMALAAFIGIFVGFEAFYDCWFSAMMQLDYAAKSRFWSALVSVLMMAAAVLLKLDLWWVVMVGMTTPLVKLAFDYYYSGGYAWRMQAPDWARIRCLLKDSLPLWWMGILYIVLARVDTFLLVGLLPHGKGDYQLGVYAAAYRFSEMLSLVVVAIAPTMLPVLVQAKKEEAAIRHLASVSTRVIMAMLYVATLLMFWYAPLIIRVFYGRAYMDAVGCLQVLVWSQALVGVNTLCYQIMMIYNLQGRRLVLMTSVVVVAVNIVLNIWLIPAYGAMGSSVATVVTEIVALIQILYFVSTLTPNRLVRDVVGMPVCCALACAPVIWLGWPWGIISVVLLAGILYATRMLTPADVKMLAAQRLEE